MNRPHSHLQRYKQEVQQEETRKTADNTKTLSDKKLKSQVTILNLFK